MHRKKKKLKTIEIRNMTREKAANKLIKNVFGKYDENVEREYMREDDLQKPYNTFLQHRRQLRGKKYK